MSSRPRRDEDEQRQQQPSVGNGRVYTSKRAVPETGSRLTREGISRRFRRLRRLGGGGATGRP